MELELIEKIEETLNLPTLEGSEKQIAWARDLRAKFLKREAIYCYFSSKIIVELKENTKKLIEKKDETKEEYFNLVEKSKKMIDEELVKSYYNLMIYYIGILLIETSAKWIIEHREELY